MKKLPDDVREFIRTITLDLQQHRSKTPEQLDIMFQRAYSLYAKYDVEGWRAKHGVKEEIEAEEEFYFDDDLDKSVAAGEISSKEAAMRLRHYKELQVLRSKGD